MARFFEQKLNKISWKKIIQKFQNRKKMVQQPSWNHYKMLKEIDFWPSAGRESLWATGEKVGFSKAHCEVQKQPNLDFFFRGLNPKSIAQMQSTYEVFGTWSLAARIIQKSDFPELWGQFNKIHMKFKIRGPRENIIWTFN
jgi:hypothetical protein